MVALYNDIDRFCCKWTENLVGAGYIPDGITVCDRILMLNYRDLSHFDQCHFFCGIGGWPLALRLAGWPDDETVWTGSCPCQPFSLSSVNRKKTADDKHLWPDFRQLIEKYRPPTIFGEQVAGSDGISWLSEIRSDFEKIGYAVGAANLSADFFGFPHKRKRLFWVANSTSEGLERLEQRRNRLRLAETSAPTQCYDFSIQERFQTEPNPSSLPMFNGFSRPVDMVRAFGNSLVPQVAAYFIKAFMAM